MTKKDLYICPESKNECKNKCSHATPHKKRHNCLSGTCKGEKLPCIRKDDLDFIKEEEFKI